MLIISLASDQAFSQEIEKNSQKIEFSKIEKYAIHAHAPDVLRDGAIREKLKALLGGRFR